MTICIASICDTENGEAIVLGSDKMITLDNLGSFEHPIQKFEEIDNNKALMISGTPQIFKKVLDNVELDETEFGQACEDIHERMKNIKDQKMKRQLIDPLNLEEGEVGKILFQEPTNPWIQEIQEAIAKHSLNTEFLLTGFDDQGKAQIANITEANITHMRHINYSVIGSGSTQAINTLLFQEHSKNTGLKTALYNVFKAKKNAEAQRGVGKKTDLAILHPEQGIIKMGEEDLKELEGIYQEELEYGKKHENLQNIEANLGK